MTCDALRPQAAAIAASSPADDSRPLHRGCKYARRRLWRVRTPDKRSTGDPADHSPLSREFLPNLRGRLVGPEPHINRLPQEPVLGPGQVGDLRHQLRLDPMPGMGETTPCEPSAIDATALVATGEAPHRAPFAARLAGRTRKGRALPVSPRPIGPRIPFERPSGRAMIE
jgi:hypothetical protein